MCLKYGSIIGAHFAAAPLSFIWIYGNLSAYMDSYFRFSCSPACADGDSKWILGLSLTMACPGTLLTKVLVDKIGLKWTGVAGAIILNVALFGSAWTMRVSVAGTTVLLGAVNGFCMGLTLVVAYQLVSSWAPEKSAILMASTSGASTAIAILENQVITAIVNPENFKADVMQDSKAFFSQRQVLDNVPTALITYAAMTVSFQIIGYLLVSPPPPSSSKSSNLKESPTPEPSQSTLSNEIAKSGMVLSKSSKSSEFQDGAESYGSNDNRQTSLEVSEKSKNKSGSSKAPGHSSVDIIEEKSTCPVHSQTQKRSLKPSEALKTPVFYATLMYGTSTLYGLVLKANYYKEFGLLYIHDDRYLTLIGTLIPIIATTSRIAFGVLINKRILTIKAAVIINLCGNCVLCSFWYFAPQVSAVLYLFLVLGMAIVQSSFFAIVPAASLSIFGPAHFSTNYGMLLSSLSIVGILEPIVFTPLTHILGWNWLFASCSIICLVTLLFAVCVNFDINSD